MQSFLYDDNQFAVSVMLLQSHVKLWKLSYPTVLYVNHLETHVYLIYLPTT